MTVELQEGITTAAAHRCQHSIAKLLDNQVTWSDPFSGCISLKLRSFWKELLICMVSLGAFIVSERVLFPGKFKNGFTFQMNNRKIKVSPYILRAGAFGGFSLLLQVLVWLKTRGAGSSTEED